MTVFMLFSGLEIASPEKFVPLVPLLMEQITHGKVKSKSWNRQSNVVRFLSALAKS